MVGIGMEYLQQEFWYLGKNTFKGANMIILK
jgi:hypothetical protein